MEESGKVEVAEWSKAVDSGSIPKGRGFKSRPQHFLYISIFLNNYIKIIKTFYLIKVATK